MNQRDSSARNDLGVIFEQASPFLLNLAVKVCEKIILEKKSDVVFFTFFFVVVLIISQNKYCHLFKE